MRQARADLGGVAAGALDVALSRAAIVWGTDDPFVSLQSVERLRRTLPQSTLVEVERGRHFLPEESPERIVEVICGLLDTPSGVFCEPLVPSRR
ncbi:MAG: alpha/beta fold hydrolase [Gemmatimonadota bacterium]